MHTCQLMLQHLRGRATMRVDGPATIHHRKQGGLLVEVLFEIVGSRRLQVHPFCDTTLHLLPVESWPGDGPAYRNLPHCHTQSEHVDGTTSNALGNGIWGHPPPVHLVHARLSHWFP